MLVGKKYNLIAFVFYFISAFYEATLHYLTLLYSCFYNYSLTLVFTSVKINCII